MSALPAALPVTDDAGRLPGVLRGAALACVRVARPCAALPLAVASARGALRGRADPRRRRRRLPELARA